MHVEGVLANNDYILNGCYIEITSNCNLRCIHCYNESGELRDQISVEAFKNVLGVMIIQRKHQLHYLEESRFFIPRCGNLSI